jgi:hypothetical protein
MNAARQENNTKSFRTLATITASSPMRRRFKHRPQYRTPVPWLKSDGRLAKR